MRVEILEVLVAKYQIRSNYYPMPLSRVIFLERRRCASVHPFDPLSPASNRLPLPRRVGLLRQYGPPGATAPRLRRDGSLWHGTADLAVGGGHGGLWASRDSGALEPSTESSWCSVAGGATSRRKRRTGSPSSCAAEWSGGVSGGLAN